MRNIWIIKVLIAKEFKCIENQWEDKISAEASFTDIFALAKTLYFKNSRINYILLETSNLNI